MTAQPTSDVNATSDEVHHPPHYNTHPSGIECVEYAELLPGNLSHVCVYVWRHAHKGHAEQDLEKALWFLNREIYRTGIEESDARAALGLTDGTPLAINQISVRTRITDRLRHLRPFIKNRDFVACVVDHLLSYNLDKALALITQHLKQLRAEKA